MELRDRLRAVLARQPKYGAREDMASRALRILDGAITPTDPDELDNLVAELFPPNAGQDFFDADGFWSF